MRQENILYNSNKRKFVVCQERQTFSRRDLLPEILYETLNHIACQIFNQSLQIIQKNSLYSPLLISTNIANRQHNIIALQKASIYRLE